MRPPQMASVEGRLMLKAVQLGENAGIKVSELCLGTMNFGEPGRGHQGDWTLGPDEARPIFKAAIDNGLFYFDCADTYGVGACEKVVGGLLRELLPRDEYVLATKVAMPMGRGPNQSGLSRKHIMEGVDASLGRLGLDYIDHLVIHRHPQGVPGHQDTPIEETMEALHDVVQAGKVLYLGASSMFAWQFTELQMLAAASGWTRFVSMQNHYNLVYHGSLPRSRPRPHRRPLSRRPGVRHRRPGGGGGGATGPHSSANRARVAAGQARSHLARGGGVEGESGGATGGGGRDRTRRLRCDLS